MARWAELHSRQCQTRRLARDSVACSRCSRLDLHALYCIMSYKQFFCLSSSVPSKQREWSKCRTLGWLRKRDGIGTEDGRLVEEGKAQLQGRRPDDDVVACWRLPPQHTFHDVSTSERSKREERYEHCDNASHRSDKRFTPPDETCGPFEIHRLVRKVARLELKLLSSEKTVYTLYLMSGTQVEVDVDVERVRVA